MGAAVFHDSKFLLAINSTSFNNLLYQGWFLAPRDSIASSAFPDGAGLYKNVVQSTVQIGMKQNI
jgi:hypothetical protein